MTGCKILTLSFKRSTRRDQLLRQLFFYKLCGAKLTALLGTLLMIQDYNTGDISFLAV